MLTHMLHRDKVITKSARRPKLE